jgi:hypothetical protein
MRTLANSDAFNLIILKTGNLFANNKWERNPHIALRRYFTPLSSSSSSSFASYRSGEYERSAYR